MEQQLPKENKKSQQSSNNFLRYSGLVFQMAATILIGTWGGMQLDELLYNDFPVFTIGLVLLSVVLSIYQAAKNFLSNK